MSTATYVDLMFSWAHARLGDAAYARFLMSRVMPDLAGSGDPVHEWAGQAFEYRIGQALDGLAHAGDWPPDLAHALEHLDDDCPAGRSHRYIVDRLRHRSLLLEPDRRPEPYVTARRSGKWFEQALDSLEKAADAQVFSDRFHTLLARVGRPARPGRYVRALTTAANGGHRLAPEAGDVLFARALGLIARFLWTAPRFRHARVRVPALLEAVTGLAVSRRDPVFPCRAALLLADWARAGGPATGRPTAALLFGLLLSAFYSLDMPTDAAALLDAVEECGIEFRDPGTSAAALAGPLPRAGCLSWLGQPKAAAGVLGPVLARLTGAFNRLPDPESARLAGAYARAVGMAPIVTSGPLLLDLFRTLPPVLCCFSTHTHYSRLHAHLAEAAVLAVATDDFSPPAALARRLGDEEVRGRRALLVDLREAAYGWGDRDWQTWPPAGTGVTNAHAA